MCGQAEKSLLQGRHIYIEASYGPGGRARPTGIDQESCIGAPELGEQLHRFPFELGDVDIARQASL